MNDYLSIWIQNAGVPVYHQDDAHVAIEYVYLYIGGLDLAYYLEPLTNTQVVLVLAYTLCDQLPQLLNISAHGLLSSISVFNIHVYVVVNE